MKTYYDDWRRIAQNISNYFDSMPTLKIVFNRNFFKEIDTRIDELEKQKSHKFGSMLIFFRDDSQKNFKQSHLLDSYLKLIFSNPTCNKVNKKHLCSQFRGWDSTDTLFEVSILGNLLKQLDLTQIKLFPKTIGNSDVEARVNLDGRWIYLDVTVLNDTQEDTQLIDEMINKGRTKNTFSWIDMDKDEERFERKLVYKSNQFMPNQPNAIILGNVATRLPIYSGLEEPKFSSNLNNIGVVFEFDRANLKKVRVDDCDISCSLTDEEIKILSNLFSGAMYAPLVYGV